MSSLRFHCAICGTGLNVGAESTGGVIECPACRHVVPVPAQLAGPSSAPTLALFPKGILALELKFLCPDCNAKLRIDARLEGRPVNCPNCSHQIRIPSWSTNSPDRALQSAQLSEAEIEFLSSPQDTREPQAATR